MLALAALAMLAGFQCLALPELLALLDGLPLHPPAAADLHRLQAAFIVLGLLGTGCALILLRHGLRILQRDQTPPDDAWLWRDARVVRGIKARRRAWFTITTALLVGVICAALVVYIVLTLQSFMPYGLRDGVSIVEMKTAPRQRSN